MENLIKISCTKCIGYDTKLEHLFGTASQTKGITELRPLQIHLSFSQSFNTILFLIMHQVAFRKLCSIRSPLFLMPYILDSDIISPSYSAKYLCVLFQSDMSLDKHISSCFVQLRDFCRICLLITETAAIQ